MRPEAGVVGPIQRNTSRYVEPFLPFWQCTDVSK
jgi:hypothetical protein